MPVSEAKRLRLSGAPRTSMAVALACWGVFAAVFAASAFGSDLRVAASVGLLWSAAAFAGVGLSSALRAGGTVRTFWALFGSGLAFRFAGDVIWTISRLSGLAPEVRPLALQDVAYAASYPLLIGAMLWLVGRTTRRIRLVVALDALAIMLSAGTLAWHFVLGPAAAEARLDGMRNAAVALAQPVCDAALLYLALVVLSTRRRPPFTGPLTAVFLSFVAADGVYLLLRARSPYEIGNWPDLLWSLGLIFAGLAALRGAPAGFAPQHRIHPWRVFSFWLGPLSPPVHYAILLVWSAYAQRPLPEYALAGGAVLLIYLALRVALVSFASSRLGAEQAKAARELEQGRVLYELHDTVKQGVHGISLTLRGAIEHERLGEREAAREAIEHALETARETEFRISRPYDEFQVAHGEAALSHEQYLRHRLRRFEEYFGVKSHADFRAPLDALSPFEARAVYRIVAEAFWNVAKHSGASNVYVESRRVGEVLILRVRDDGQGFDPQNPPPGMGCGYMRRRAAEIGAELDIVSGPGRGTAVELRFRGD